MILYELTKLYEQLLKQKKLREPGWVDEKVSYAIMLRKDGTIAQLFHLGGDDEKQKPSKREVPMHANRTSGVLPFFLWDNAGYLLGIDFNGKPEKAKEHFEASKQLHLQLLKAVESDAAVAVKNFFETWNPEAALEQECLKDEGEALKGANLVFWYDEKPVVKDEAIREMWNAHLQEATDEKQGICMVTGQKGTIARLHPLIKGVRGAQSSGAALVSFNASAFNSYGVENGENAPTSEYAANAYGAALNYLLADRGHVHTVGDITLLGWAESADEGYQDFLFSALNDKNVIRSEEVQDALKQLAQGRKIAWNESELNPENEFYVLGLSPNAARLSIRFFLKNEFGQWLRNIQAHEKRLEIVKPSYEEKKILPIWLMCKELKASGESGDDPRLASAMLQAILNNTRYPEEMLYATLRRIRAGQDEENAGKEKRKNHGINWKRMAMLKAYLLKNSEKEREECSVGWNAEADNQAYLLGGLFSILENIQLASVDGNLNTTIKDQYFNSMCSTPVLVFAQLMKLKEAHMKKLRRDKVGLAVELDKKFMELIGKLDMNIPKQLNAEEQAVFMLGYYHQTQERYKKKED